MTSLVRDLNNNNQYVAKIILNNQNDFQNEIQITIIASGLNNPNIIRLIRHGVGTLTFQGEVKNNINYMIFEYCPKGDLFRYVLLRRFSERHAKYIFKKILLGVQALHNAGYCHKDLKLDNILLDQNFYPKIFNFSFAKQFQQNNNPIILNDFVGTRPYSPPQILKREPYNGEKADIFSLGVILFTLASHIFGFNQATQNDNLYRNILIGNIAQYWESIFHEIGFNFSDELKNLYIRMVAPNENNRPNIAEILQHQWFNEINNLNPQQINQLENEVRNEFINRENELNQNNQNILNFQ